jgi:tetratricopeptide (TPR) repeat protein
MRCTAVTRCVRCWPSWSGCPGWSGWGWPRSAAELAAHLEAITGTALPAEQVEGIFARSEGNPFYAEQLLAAATGQPEADLEQSLREAIGAGVLATDVATGSYAFRHALPQEAVYGDLLPGEQVRLNAAYASLLAAEPDGAAAELAHHCLASHDLAGALAASVRAAEAAAAVLAPAEAPRHLSSSLRLWERAPDPAAVTGTDRVELTLRAAAAASAAGEHRRAASLAQDAVRTADATADPARAARAHERLGLYLFETGSVEEALRARARAVELVPAQPPTRLRARVTAAMAQALVAARRRDEARRWCDQALAAARGAGSADDEADVLITLGVIEQYDDPANACSLFAAARAQAADAGNPEIEMRALYDLAEVSSQLGDLASARAAFDDGARLAERTGLGWSGAGSWVRRGQIRVRYHR